MRSTTSISPAEIVCIPLTEEQKRIEGHKKIAEHLLAAAANNFKAAIYLKAGEYSKANQCSDLAKQYVDLANEHRQRMPKYST